MAIRSDLMRPPVFVAQPLAEPQKQTSKRTKDDREKRFLDSRIANSVRRTFDHQLMEIVEPAVGPVVVAAGAPPARADSFLRQPKRLPLQRRFASLNMTNGDQLFLFLKLDLLAEELRIAGVFCQERNYGG